MSTVKATYSGWVAPDGVPVLLSAGEEYETDHPLVRARPDLFDMPATPEPEVKAEPEQPRRGPGRPPGSRNKAKDDG
jgi:hypothetical protein